MPLEKSESKPPMIYTSPNGEVVDPVDYLYGVWASDSLGAIWYNMLGYFILDNVPGFFPELSFAVECQPIARKDLKHGMVLRSAYIKDILATEVFDEQFWCNPEHPNFLMDDILHSAFKEALGSGLLVEKSLRLKAVPVLRHGAERIELKLVWIEAVIPETKA